MTRINYTGRKRIKRDRVRLRLTTNGSVKLHADELNLDGIALPSDAGIVIEAQRQTRFMRLSCGTVSTPDLPAGAALTEFDVAEGLHFRVKVVGVTGADEGKILAAADGLIATSEGDTAGRTALLPFRPAPLGQRLWKLEATEGDWPALLINESVADWHQFARTPSFQALVLPEVLRQIAIWVVEQLDDAQEEDTPAGAWRQFLSGFGQDPVEVAPDDEDERAGWARDWAEEIADKFSRRHKFRDVLAQSEEDSS